VRKGFDPGQPRNAQGEWAKTASYLRRLTNDMPRSGDEVIRRTNGSYLGRIRKIGANQWVSMIPARPGDENGPHHVSEPYGLRYEAENQLHATPAFRESSMRMIRRIGLRRTALEW
jgi:hypothetical protein